MNRVWMTWLLFMQLCSVAMAQQIVETVFDIDAGLPFQEVTGVVPGIDGRLWIEYSNQSYLSRFDGISWTHIKFSDVGMPDGLSIVRELKDGLVLQKFSALNNSTEVVHYDLKKKWTRTKFDGVLVWDFFQLFDQCVFFDKNHRILFLTKEGFVSSDIFIPKDVLAEDEEPRSAQFADSTTIVFYLSRKQEVKNVEKVVVYDFKQQRFLYHDTFDPTSEISTLVAPGFVLKRSKTNTRLFEIKQNRQDQTFQFNKNSFDVINIFHFGSRPAIKAGFSVKNEQFKNDIYAYDKLRNVFVKTFTGLSEGLRPSGLHLDEATNLWYATHSGLVRRKSNILFFPESENNMVNALHTLAEDEEGKIWFGGYNQGGWSFWDGKSIKRPTDKRLLNNRVLPGSFHHLQKLFFFEEAFDFNVLSYIQKNRLKKMRFRSKVNPGYFFTVLKSGRMAGGLAGKGLLLFDPDDPDDYLMVGREKGLMLENVLTISEDREGRLWMGRLSQGLACFDPVKDTVVTWLVNSENPRSLGVMSSKIDFSGDLWIGSNSGLYFLPQPDIYDVKRFSVFDHLQQVHLTGNDQSRISSLAENKKYWMAGSEKGLHLVDKSAPIDREGRRRVYTLWYGEDIPGKGSEQNALLVDSKGFLWLGANEGALRIDVDRLRFDNTPPSLSLESVFFGNTKIESGADIVTGPKGQRSLEIVWAAAGNAHLQNNVFATILVLNSKLDTVFFADQTRDKNIKIAYLAPDNYQLLIKGYKNNQLGFVLEKSILVPKLLSERTSFWVILVLTITAIPLILMLMYSRSRRIEAEFELALEKAKRDQDAYRLKSLSNFFNPHFINNALHWLQSKYRKDAETATMIDSMAGNVDILYQNIQHGLAYHSLSKEIKLVNNYLSIQQLRFGNTLQIKFINDMKDGKLNMLIPSMLLQIHVENAVEKGIRNRVGANTLIMHFIEDVNGVTVVIEDDGKGRSIEENIIKNRKGSTEVMRDLVSILNAYNQSKIEVRYEDLFIEKKYGTRVTIYLPNNYNYEI